MYPCSFGSIVFGMSWVATVPLIEPPNSRISPALSVTQFAALRTWTSSKGGNAVFRLM